MITELWQPHASGWCLWQVRLCARIRDASLKCCCLWGITTAVILMANEVVESKIPHPNILRSASFMHCDHCMGKLLDVCLTRYFQWWHAGVLFISSVLIKVKVCRYVLVCLSFEGTGPFYFNPTETVSRKASKQHDCPSSYLHFWCLGDCRCTQTSFCSIYISWHRYIRFWLI